MNARLLQALAVPTIALVATALIAARPAHAQTQTEANPPASAIEVGEPMNLTFAEGEVALDASDSSVAPEQTGSEADGSTDASGAPSPQVDCMTLNDVYAVDAITGYRSATFPTGRPFFLKARLSNACGATNRRFVKFQIRPYGCSWCTPQELASGTIYVSPYNSTVATSANSFRFTSSASIGYHNLTAETWGSDAWGNPVLDESRTAYLYHPY